ncbi:MAG TPA: AAA family ATPase [Calditerricola sp.]
MILRQLFIRGFGKWENATFAFSPGFNLIEAPNEAGKTTLLEALLAALYGLKRDYVSQRKYLPQYERYKPWTAKAYGTVVEYEVLGQVYRLERNLDRQKDESRLYLLPEMADITRQYPQDKRRERNFVEGQIGLNRTLFEQVAILHPLPVEHADHLLDHLRGLSAYGDETSVAPLVEALEREIRAIGKTERGQTPYATVLRELRKATAEWERAQQRAQRLRRLEQEHREACQRLAEAERAVAACEERLAHVRAEMRRLDALRAREQERQVLLERRQRAAEALAEWNDAVEQLAQLDAALAEVRHAAAYQPGDAERARELADRVARAEQSAAEVEGRLSAIREALKALEKGNAYTVDWSAVSDADWQAYERAVERWQEATARLAQLGEESGQVPGAVDEAERAALRGALRALEAHQAELRALKEKQAEAEGRRAAAEAERAALRAQQNQRRELARRVAEKEGRLRQLRERQARASGRGIRRVGLALGAAFLALGGVLLLWQPLWGVLLAAIGVLGLVAVGWYGRSAAPADETRAVVDVLTREWEADQAALAALPTEEEIARRAEDLERQMADAAREAEEVARLVRGKERAVEQLLAQWNCADAEAFYALYHEALREADERERLRLLRDELQRQKARAWETLAACLEAWGVTPEADDPVGQAARLRAERSAYAEDAAKREALAREQAVLHQRWTEVQAELEADRAALAAILARNGVDTVEALAERDAAHRRWTALMVARSSAAERLEALKREADGAAREAALVKVEEALALLSGAATAAGEAEPDPTGTDEAECEGRTVPPSPLKASGETDAVARISARLEALRREEEALKEELSRHAAERDRLRAAASRLQGEMAALEGDGPELADLRSRLDVLGAEVRRLDDKREALERGLALLREVAKAMHRDVAPILNRHASEVMARITAGRYDVRVNPNERMAITAIEQETQSARPQDVLSRGTSDQLYFALRVALLKRFSYRTPLPALLDDSFAHYDDERLLRALAYLGELAKTHQVLLFTCRDRERAALRELGIPFTAIPLVREPVRAVQDA